MSTCQDDHRHEPKFDLLPLDQGGHGRHRCCGCAYEKGFQATFRYKSPYAAFAKGYYDGVAEFYT